MSDNNETTGIDDTELVKLNENIKKYKIMTNSDISEVIRMLEPQTSQPTLENKLLNIRLHRYQASEIYNTNPAFLKNDMILAFETLCYMVKNEKSLSIVEQPGSGKTFFLKLLEGITTFYPFEIYLKLFNMLPEKDRMIHDLNKIVVINLDLKMSHDQAKQSKQESEDSILYYLSEDFDNQIRRKVALSPTQIEKLNEMKNKRGKEIENPLKLQSGLHKELLAYLMDEVSGGCMEKIVYSSLNGTEIDYNSEIRNNDDNKVEHIIDRLEQDPNIKKTKQKISTIVVIVDEAEILHTKGIESTVLKKVFKKGISICKWQSIL